MGIKSDLSDFELGIVVAARWAVLSISEKKLNAAISGVYRERLYNPRYAEHHL